MCSRSHKERRRTRRNNTRDSANVHGEHHSCRLRHRRSLGDVQRRRKKQYVPRIHRRNDPRPHNHRKRTVCYTSVRTTRHKCTYIVNRISKTLDIDDNINLPELSVKIALKSYVKRDRHETNSKQEIYYFRWARNATAHNQTGAKNVYVWSHETQGRNTYMFNILNIFRVLYQTEAHKLASTPIVR